jgi:NAD(P)-dependent dehydrogenase (short-subunit alcohol dehydrogenase family)
LFCRNQQKTQVVIEEIKKETNNDKVEFVYCDLTDWKSVVEAAKTVNKRDIPIHGLVNNAAVIAIPKYTECKQGIEMQISTNHMGHFILTRELWPAIKKAGPGARIVNVSSDGHGLAFLKNTGYFKWVPGFDFENALKKECYHPLSHYGYVSYIFTLFIM